MILKTKDKKKVILICGAVFSALLLVLLVFMLVIRMRSLEEEEESEVFIAKEPAMVPVFDSVEPEEEAEHFEPETGESEAVSDNNNSPATKEEIEARLKEIDGYLPSHEKGYIFVGDSRFVFMNQVDKISDNENLFVVAKVGEGYSWLDSTALPQIKRIVSSGLFPEWEIVVCLGINDLDNLEKYKKKFSDMAGNYSLSLVSVGPITSYGNLSNAKIENFNSGLKELDLPYIDTYRILTLTGFNSSDGLHYDADSSRKIFKGILLGLQDEGKATLTKDASAVLSKASLGKKKSLQSDILSQNKFVPKTVSDNSLYQALMESAEQAAAESAAATEHAANGENTATEHPQENTQRELTQEEIDALYGRQEEHEEEEEEEEEEDDDDDDDE